METLIQLRQLVQRRGILQLLLQRGGAEQRGAQGLAQFACGQCQRLQGGGVVAGIQFENVQLIGPLNAAGKALAADSQRQVEASPGKGFVFLPALFQQREDIRPGLKKQLPGSGNGLDDLIFLYAKNRLEQFVQQCKHIFILFHDAPPDCDRMCRTGENFPGRFPQYSTYGFILAETGENSKGKPSKR